MVTAMFWSYVKGPG